MQIDIIEASTVVGAISLLITTVFAVVHFIEQPKNNKKEIRAIKKELLVVCKCLAACLDGLHQLGANDKVTEAVDMMKDHLNNAAHDKTE